MLRTQWSLGRILGEPCGQSVSITHKFVAHPLAERQGYGANLSRFPRKNCKIVTLALSTPFFAVRDFTSFSGIFVHDVFAKCFRKLRKRSPGDNSPHLSAAYLSPGCCGAAITSSRRWSPAPPLRTWRQLPSHACHRTT